ncbi:hypothetical protein LMG22037_06280 [Paraburkholderia phenoliruptrix]|uniref:Uncharacterized protein n=1 Tax=Paraburkholderia phenoliruptrix TaxID=252970 RepID=A0A6J5CPD4_9BURK|nr:hypothetical protein LMG22037_06280 [Paraburkholderia phenoliruptrix]
MPVWRVASVNDEPQLSLIHWKVLETQVGTRHFAGQDERDLTGRVSTPILEFDPALKRGTTQSGRVYQLVGPTGWSDNAQYLWKRFCTVNNVTTYWDVTKDMFDGDTNDDASRAD